MAISQRTSVLAAFARVMDQTPHPEPSQPAPNRTPPSEYAPYEAPTDPQDPSYSPPYSPQYSPQWPLATPAASSAAGAGTARRRRIRIAVGAAAVLAAACTAAFAIGASTGSVSGNGLALPPANQQQYVPPSNPYGNFPFPNSGNGNSGNGNSGNGNSGNGNTNSTGTATTAQSVGVVDINTVLGYEGARAAGTGMVVTSDGEILTNNHVIQGATSIQVTVVSTGKSYSATVVGTDPTDDVAVIQLQNASGLATASFGDSGTVKVGDAVTGVGNAGGAGGTPSAATGHVTALNQTITASDEGGANSETISGLIESDAPIQAGDSGGPLYNAAGKIVGMDTAAQTGRFSSTAIAAYSIPIDKALSIAHLIESGQESSTIHIGLSGFLGVSVAASSTSGGALISGVVADGPAAKAGLGAGDVITAIDGTSIAGSDALHNAMLSTEPGQRVRVAWTDQSGAKHSASVTLIAGPAD